MRFKPLTQAEIDETIEFFKGSCRKDREEFVCPKQFRNYGRIRKLGIYSNPEVDEYLEDCYRGKKLAELKALTEKAVGIKLTHTTQELIELRIEYTSWRTYQFCVHKSRSKKLYEEIQKKYWKPF